MLPTVPVVMDKEGRMERQFDIYSRLLKDRVIILDGEVRDELASSIVSQILFLEADNPGKDIYLYVNSPGGAVSAGLAIIDAMDYVTSDVVTVCIGQACSMGAMITMCGAKGKRYMTKYARFMVHQVSSGASGTVSSMRDSIDEAERVNSILAEIIEERCGRAKKEVKKVMARDTWMSTDEAIKFGAIDQMMARR